MIIRLNEKLGISEEQKLELVGLLFSFLKKVRTEESFRCFTTEQLASCWFRYVEKPAWMEEKIKDEIDFIAGICEFIDTYKNRLDEKDIKEVEVRPKISLLNKDVFELLMSMCS